jgi:hypothetical protein
MTRLYLILLTFFSAAIAGLVVIQQFHGSGNLFHGQWFASLGKHFDRSHLIESLKSLPKAGPTRVDEFSISDPSARFVVGEGTHVVAGRPRQLRTNQVVRLKTEAEAILGRVLAWDEVQLVLLSDRGALRYIPWSAQTEFQDEPGTLQPISAAFLHNELQQEFGPNFTVRTSAQFVVVQPKSCRRDWARSMQQFYGNVQTYCSARQVPMKSPQFPLVAIVLPSRQAMVAYAAKQQDRIGKNFLAYYSLNSNRVLMYDEGPDANQQNAALELATVFHEAFHQVAFNTGLHKRTAAPPLWVSEGMASAFETPGMSDHRRSKSLDDRVHPDQLRLFLEYAKRPEFGETLSQLVKEDSLFGSDPTQAYAMAWAMSFYWLEHAPHAFADYLKTCNQRAAFVDANPERRQREFRNLTQSSEAEFAIRLKKYFERL